MNVCMLLHKSAERDSRVRREARSLVRAGHAVTIVHVPPAGVPEIAELDGARVVSAAPPTRVRRLPLQAHRVLMLAWLVARAVRERPNVVHAHDAAMLLPAFVAARLAGARVVYDSHEYALGVPYRTRGWALLVAAIEGALVRRCARVVTVSEGIAGLLQRRYGLPRMPVVLRNFPDRAALGAAAPRDRGDAPVVLHQGAPAEHRGCEQLVRAVARLDGVRLLFLGDGEPAFAEALRELARREGVADRVELVPGVPLERLLATTAEVDVGVSLLQATCENHRWALPNKVFEYVAAGVPVVVNDLPELSALVARHGIGWSVDGSDPDAIARGLRAALEARGDPVLGERLARAADELCWEREEGRLIDLYAGL